MASSSSTLVESSNFNDLTPAQTENSESQILANSTVGVGQVKSPWGKNNTANNVKLETSFAEVMSEQLANELQINEDVKLCELVTDKTPIQQENADGDVHTQDEMLEGDTSNDALLAQMLQAQMDKEYNQYLSEKEYQANKYSKVKLSFNNYRTDEMFISDEDEDFSDEEDEGTIHDISQPNRNMLEIKNDKGYVMFGKKMVTKHDGEISGRRNVARLEDSFPVLFRTGDATGMDMQLDNKIYNRLKKHAFTEQRRGQRLHENKEHYTAEHAVDERTRLILHRLIDRGIVAGVNGVISIGKEAVVLHVDGGDIAAADLEPVLNENNQDISCLQIPKECAVKIYKTTLNEFKTRDKYIKDDYRFKDRFKKLNPRKIIHMWAEKEMHNLVRMEKAGIPCPKVILLKKHVLAMSFIGVDQQPAPKLKSVILSSSQKKSAYRQVLDMMKTLYHQCKLVHADLSEFNLLWHDDKVWMIDVSQSVEPSHPHGLEFLRRDCTNISKFFTNLGVPDVLGPMDLFNKVSGLSLPTDSETSFLQAIETLEKSSEEHAHQGRNKSKKFLEESVIDEI